MNLRSILIVLSLAALSAPALANEFQIDGGAAKSIYKTLSKLGIQPACAPETCLVVAYQFQCHVRDTDQQSECSYFADEKKALQVTYAGNLATKLHTTIVENYCKCGPGERPKLEFKAVACIKTKGRFLASKYVCALINQ